MLVKEFVQPFTYTLKKKKYWVRIDPESGRQGGLTDLYISVNFVNLNVDSASL